MVGDGELVSDLDHSLLSLVSVFDLLRGSWLTKGEEVVERCEVLGATVAPERETSTTESPTFGSPEIMSAIRNGRRW